MYAAADLLLEERYKQLETNFKAIVADLKARPNWDGASSLDSLLNRLDGELKHSLVRQQAANMSAPQRLEERTAILQRTFRDVVELMSEPMRASSGRPNQQDVLAATSSPSPHGTTPSNAASSADGWAPATPQTHHLPSHPWSGDVYACATTPSSPPSGQRDMRPNASTSEGNKLSQRKCDVGVVDAAHESPSNPMASIEDRAEIAKLRAAESQLHRQLASAEAALQELRALSASKDQEVTVCAYCNKHLLQAAWLSHVVLARISDAYVPNTLSFLRQHAPRLMCSARSCQNAKSNGTH